MSRSRIYSAYLGMQKIGRPKAGETVVISGAAGATESVAGQIANIMGAKRAVGIAGSDEKCTWLKKDLGFDDALNYKDSEFERKLAEATPDDIDVFWDNGELILSHKGLRLQGVPMLILILCSQLEEIFLTQPWPARTSSPDLLCVVASASITLPSPKVQGT
ncbi:hypothetical protein BDV36DRAFT_269406 [Aspergillus pseudocaelatus]|uniref:Alcohol dehydrogenase-like C-terminal domain-containing protein n=1 Tax=Aspergillus pseudocaelatus TaxID=1825620 RepID=A0ABQ6W814_9EURO|nr:hypothetical protein BDV36DRAFT_269406 [Aspergillus pseudocaelatus]